MEPTTPPAAPAAGPPESPANPFAQFAGLFHVMREQPALAVTLAYVALTAAGMLYEFNLFRRFGLNILDYADPSDFVLASLRDPVVVLLCLVPVPLLYALSRTGDHMRRRVRRRREARGIVEDPTRRSFRQRAEEWRRSPPVVMVMVPLFILIYAYDLTFFYARSVAHGIREGQGKRVHVEAIGGASPADALLLGTTGRFVFLYDPADSATFAVPVESISRLVMLPPGAKPPPAAPRTALPASR